MPINQAIGTANDIGALDIVVVNRRVARHEFVELVLGEESPEANFGIRPTVSFPLDTGHQIPQIAQRVQTKVLQHLLIDGRNRHGDVFGQLIGTGTGEGVGGVVPLVVFCGDHKVVHEVKEFILRLSIVVAFGECDFSGLRFFLRRLGSGSGVFHDVAFLGTECAGEQTNECESAGGKDAGTNEV